MIWIDEVSLGGMSMPLEPPPYVDDGEKFEDDMPDDGILDEDSNEPKTMRMGTRVSVVYQWFWNT